MRTSWTETWAAVADTIAKRSACGVRQVGAVIVSPDNTAHWAGYNGPPAGYTEVLGLTKVIGCASYCPQGTLAPGESVWASAPGDADRPCLSIHAEINALIKSDPELRQNGTAFSTAAPCWKCALAIANSGVDKLVCRDWEADRIELKSDIVELYNKLDIRIEKWPNSC